MSEATSEPSLYFQPILFWMIDRDMMLNTVCVCRSAPSLCALTTELMSMTYSLVFPDTGLLA